MTGMSKMIEPNNKDNKESPAVTQYHLSQFASLPIELRHLIYQYTFVPQTILLRHMPGKVGLTTRVLPIPVALHLNRESRAEALRHYTKICFRDRPRAYHKIPAPVGPIYINPYTDSIGMGVMGEGTAHWDQRGLYGASAIAYFLGDTLDKGTVSKFSVVLTDVPRSEIRKDLVNYFAEELFYSSTLDLSENRNVREVIFVAQVNDLEEEAIDDFAEELMLIPRTVKYSHDGFPWTNQFDLPGQPPKLPFYPSSIGYHKHGVGFVVSKRPLGWKTPSHWNPNREMLWPDGNS
jgi:hypothetical protein